jgi:glycosyltransferase involved in cell wall biosynthesis
MLTEEVSAEIITLCRRWKVCFVVPFYNNRRHVLHVLGELLHLGVPVIAVSDGSTDGSEEMARNSGAHVIAYYPNRGKGYALRTAFRHALESGFHYAISVDADGQHVTSEALALLRTLDAHPGALVVGARRMEGQDQPAVAGFANRFSNFWFMVHTLQKLPDTQSGFRLYPLKSIMQIRFLGTRYEWEVEVLVKAAWHGVKVISVPVAVRYPPRAERVSFFRPWKDFGRISLMNTWLTLGAMFYGHWVILRRRLSWPAIRTFLQRHVFNHDEPLWRKAASIGLGVCMGIVPVWGWQMVSAAFLAHLLKLNKGLAVISSNISMPPMLPFIIWGSLECGALFFVPEQRLKLHLDTLSEDPLRFAAQGGLQYLTGAMALGVVAGIAAFLFSLPVLYATRRYRIQKASKKTT